MYHIVQLIVERNHIATTLCIWSFQHVEKENCVSSKTQAS